MSWYEDERRADLRWAEPPEEPRKCAECRFCIDAGFDARSDHAVCVVRYEQTQCYDDIHATRFGDDACDEFEEA